MEEVEGGAEKNNQSFTRVKKNIKKYSSFKSAFAAQ